MWLFYFYGTCLFSLSWCSLLNPPHIIEREDTSDRIIFHDDDEGMHDVFLAHAQLEDLKGNIKRQLQEHHVYVLGKMKNLEAACKPANKTSQPVIEYQVSEGGFKDPRMNLLVKTMTNNMVDIASIIMDDLETTLHNFSIKLFKRMEEKFAPLTDNVNGLRSKMAGLAAKSALIQLKTDVSNLVLSNIGALKEYLNTLASKPELTTKTYRLVELSDNLQQKVEALKGCKDSPVLADILKIATESMENLAEVKENFLNVSSSDTSCSKTPVELMLTLKEAVQENTEAAFLLSFTTGDLERNFSIRVEELTEILQRYEELTSHSTAKQISTLPTNLSTTQPPPSPSIPQQCLDSNFFISHGTPPAVCDFAVRLSKCHLEFLAFHCCRSCMNAGLITTIPNFSASRDVPVLQALKTLQQGLQPTKG